MATDSPNTPNHNDSASATVYADSFRSGRAADDRQPFGGSSSRSNAGFARPSSGRPSIEDQGTMWNQEDAIEFRVRSQNHPTRRLRLAGARYTLGNGVGCSIRLDDPTLRPLHAVLIRDAHRILVRAYSIPLLINNVRVTEGTLQQGDVLRLGNYEFELIQAKLSETQPAAPTAHRFSQTVPAPASKSMFDSSVEFQKEAARWKKLKEEAERHDQWVRSRQDELQRQADQIEAQFKALREREDEIRSQESAAVELHAEFQQRHRDLTKRQNELAVQQEQLQEQKEDFASQQKRLQSRDDEYRSQIEELLLEKEQFFERQLASEQRLVETRQQLKASQSQADQAAEAVTQMRAKFASLNEQLLALGEQQESLQSIGLERVEEHARQCKELSTARDEAIAQRDLANTERDKLVDQKASSDAKLYETQEQYDELLKTEESLRAEIEALQSEISEAREEAQSLRRDCQHARNTISELESRVRESEDRHDIDRTSWNEEMDALRKGVDELTLSLAQAEQQLAQLREDNDKLRETLSVTEEQRDEFKAKLKTSEKARVRAERENSETRQLFDRSTRDHDDTLDQIEKLEEETRQLIRGERPAAPEKNGPSIQLGILSTDEAAEETPAVENLADSSEANDEEADASILNLRHESTSEFDAPSSSEAADSVSWHTDESDSNADGLIDEAMNVVHDAETDQLLQEAEEKAASWSTPIAADEEPTSVEDDSDAWPTYESSSNTEADLLRKSDSDLEPDSDVAPEWPEDARSHLLPEERSPLQDDHVETTASPEVDVWNTAATEPAERSDNEEDAQVQQFAADFTEAAQAEADQFREARLSQEWNSHTDTSKPVESAEDETASPAPEAYNDAGPAIEAEANPFQDAFAENEASDEKMDQPLAPISEGWDQEALNRDAFDADTPGDVIFDNDMSADQTGLSQETNDVPRGSLADQLIRDLRGDASSDDEVASEVSLADSGTQMWDGQTDFAPGLQDEHLDHSDAADFGTGELEASDSFESPTWKSEETHSTDELGSTQAFSADDLQQPATELPQEEYASELAQEELVADEPVAQAETDEPEDDSIEAYMNRLLQRVSQQPGDAPVAKPEPVKAQAPAKPATPKIESAEPELEVAEVVDPNAPLIPRSQAPERNSNLSAMRELANESARSAVERSAKSQTHSSRIQALVKFMQAGVAVICGIAAVAWVHGMLKIVAAVAALLIAVICVKEGITLLSASRNKAKAKKQASDVVAVVDAEVPATTE
ncbi:peptide-binding protein [Rhodopirellula sp. JC740]|uniref:Peptide-binding protein n=1 Tax=Rhodopirellula halodulae TaxID=2894198 RepID=A0ABS8NKP2_9BACT|nr:peptide-binding protein [Rhodopirellula sp. JC740]